MMPEPLSRWRVFFLASIIACFFAGLGFTLAAGYNRANAHLLTSFANTFYVFAAAFGMSEAARSLRMHFWLNAVVKDNRKMPVSIQIDGDSGYATITRFDGQLVSLQVPDEILSEGPEAVMTFVVDALED